MDTEKRNNYSGIAALFEKIELKAFFSNYLYFAVGIELLIFLMTFLGNVGPDNGPFPWKFYFYVSFIAPLTITFLLGIFILAFNHFIFGGISTDMRTNKQRDKNQEGQSKLFKINSFLENMKRVPFLPILFVMIAGTVLLYKLDAIFLFIFSAGEKVVTYILIGSAILLSATLIFGIVWVVVNYKLSKKQLEQEYKYRNNVMDKFDVLIMHDNTVINRDGKIIKKKHFSQLGISQTKPENEDRFKILPPS